MNITEVRVKMVNDETERLRAFCSVTLDGAFVVRDLKVIDGSNGPFVAMPSRKLADRCPKCGNKNHLRARFCNECGGKLNEHRAPRDPQGRVKLHADIAHPINADCREDLQRAVIDAYQEELELAKEPGYSPRNDDYIVDDDDTGGFDDFMADLKDSMSRRGHVGDEKRFERREDQTRPTREHSGKDRRAEEPVAHRIPPKKPAFAETPERKERQKGVQEPADQPAFAEGLEPTVLKEKRVDVAAEPSEKPAEFRPSPAGASPDQLENDGFGAGVF